MKSILVVSPAETITYEMPDRVYLIVESLLAFHGRPARLTVSQVIEMLPDAIRQTIVVKVQAGPQKKKGPKKPATIWLVSVSRRSRELLDTAWHPGKYWWLGSRQEREIKTWKWN